MAEAEVAPQGFEGSGYADLIMLPTQATVRLVGFRQFFGAFQLTMLHQMRA
jgi:hypothetical protein